MVNADPTLKSCHDRDVYETASDVALMLVKRRKKRLAEVSSVDFCRYRSARILLVGFFS